MNKEEIVRTITIFCSSKEVAAEMKKSLTESMTSIELLCDTTIIAIENTLNGKLMQDCSGIDMAYDILLKEPNSKIVLYHVLPLEFIRQRKRKLDIVMSKQNVRVLEMPFSVEMLANIFDIKSEDIDPRNVKEAIDVNIASQLSSIWHDIKKISNPLDPETGWQTETLNRGIKTAKETFLMLTDKDNDYILNFLKEISGVREEVRKGESFNGIFCDIEGTLFLNGTLNTTVLALLQNYESEGKEITLWSDGNLLELQSLLKVNNVFYKIYAKRDFAGAIVEMAIDDMDEPSFSATTKIYAKKFMQVKNDLM